MFESSTVCLLFLLNCVFQSVSVCKPVSSKPGNSEVYVVAQTFKLRSELSQVLHFLLDSWRSEENEAHECFFTSESIPKSFLDELCDCASFFTSLQESVIKRNVEMFGHVDESFSSALLARKEECVQEFLQLCAISSDRLNQRKRKRLNTLPGAAARFQSVSGFSGKWKPVKFEEKLKWRDMSSVERLRQLMPHVPPHVNSWSYTHYNNHTIDAIEDVVQVKTGKIFQKILSTKFCDNELLEFYHEVCENACEPGSLDTPTISHDYSANLRDSLQCKDFGVNVSHLEFETVTEQMFSHKLLEIGNNSKKIFCVVFDDTSVAYHLGQDEYCLSKLILSINYFILSGASFFIVPIRGCFTRFAAGLVYILASCCENIVIFQPEQLSEEFPTWSFMLVYNFTTTQAIKSAFTNLLREYGTKHLLSIMETVPIQTLNKDNDFTEFLFSVNNSVLLSNLKWIKSKNKVQV